MFVKSGANAMAAPTITTTSPFPTPEPKRQLIPPLENGDRLTREEFERRYEAMPPQTRAELIEGVVYISSPLRLEHHGEPHLRLGTWLGVYCVMTPGVRGGIASTVRLDLGNEPQPDLVLLVDSRYGGQAQLDDEGYVAHAPELAGEVTASSVTIDLGDKMEAYRRNGVREYVVWRTLDRAFDWLALRGTQFQPLTPGSDGVFRSEAFPGLWLDAAALLEGRLPRVHEVLQLGLASAEHAAFVVKLQQALASRGG
jgi:hypothetical protein